MSPNLHGEAKCCVVDLDASSRTRLPGPSESHGQGQCRSPHHRPKSKRTSFALSPRPHENISTRTGRSLDAAGRVVRDVRADRLPFGGATPGTQRRRIVEVSLEHAEIRRLALARRDVEALPVAAQARHLRHQRDMRGLVVVAKVVRVGGRRIQNQRPMHAAHPTGTRNRASRVRARPSQRH